jgi:hypothetical protein
MGLMQNAFEALEHLGRWSIVTERKVELIREKMAEIKLEFAKRNGWFIPDLHEKYLQLESE